ncbi:MAG TPA: hypothetical protein VFP80_05010, partial [Thermoanaerobaculia bacterium]|nr:hypothetical protein [Thermoanaerobaculia bacterium]
MKKHIARLAITLSIFWSIVPPVRAGFGGTDLILPAAGRVEGVGGSQFYTTIWVTNPGAAAADFQMSFLRSGQSNPTPQTFHDSVGPGATKVYENAAETVFGAKNALGGVRIQSSQSLLVSSRVYNKFDGRTDADSQGLFLSGIPAHFGLTTGESGVLQGIRQNGQFRYNLFLQETAGAPIALALVLLDTAGTAIGTGNVTLQPWEHRILGAGTLVNGAIE